MAHVLSSTMNLDAYTMRVGVVLEVLSRVPQLSQARNTEDGMGCWLFDRCLSVCCHRAPGKVEVTRGSFEQGRIVDGTC